MHISAYKFHYLLFDKQLRREKDIELAGKCIDGITSLNRHRLQNLQVLELNNHTHLNSPMKKSNKKKAVDKSHHTTIDPNEIKHVRPIKATKSQLPYP